MLGQIIAFDHSVAQFFAFHRTPELTMLLSWFTYLGDARVITVIAISMAIVLIRHHRGAYVAGLFTSIAGSLIAVYALKLIVARGRPLPSFAAIDAAGYSFPSMHAACAIALYGFLIYMTWKLMHPPHHRMPWMILITLSIALIGFSRVYLGVHYPSDVIVGYIIGGAFVGLGTYVTVRLERGRANAFSRPRAALSKRA